MRSRQEIERVAAVNADFYQAIETGDIDLMDRVWAEEGQAPDLVCVNPGWPMLRGRAEIMRAWSLVMANIPYIQYVLTEDPRGVSGTIAMVTCGENVLTAGRRARVRCGRPGGGYQPVRGDRAGLADNGRTTLRQ